MAVQAGHIRVVWPGFDRSGNQYYSKWRGVLQPLPISGQYEVEIAYRIGSSPCARVLKPDLADNAPHLFSDNTLCLYRPSDWGWHGKRILAHTIIPWAANWLYFYEIWQDTGKWLGPEAPHSDIKELD